MIKKLILWSFAVLALLVGILLLRTALMPSQQVTYAAQPQIEIADSCIERLSESVRFPTIFYGDATLIDSTAFAGFVDFLETSFPLVFSRLDVTYVNDYGVLVKWPGSDASLMPFLLMAHSDVVPADAEKWTHPPFQGMVKDGFIWGRGTMDNKGNLLAIMEAAEMLLAEGYAPKQTVYLAFGHDEEVTGKYGAASIVEHLQKENVKLDFVLDEGLVITKDIPGMKVPLALVGVGEKGYLSLELSVEMESGHSAMPPSNTAIGILSAALAELEANPMPAKLNPVVKEMIAYVAPEISFLQRIPLANLWLFGKTIKGLLASEIATNAIIRTTTAVTTFQSGNETENVLPAQAQAIVNFRLMPGDSITWVVKQVKKIIKDDRVKIEIVGDRNEAPPISDIDTDGFREIQKTIAEVFPGCVISPGMHVGSSDSRYYHSLTENVYRFSPLVATREDVSRVHGNDERVSIENYKDFIRFYYHLIKD